MLGMCRSSRTLDFTRSGRAAQLAAVGRFNRRADGRVFDSEGVKQRLLPKKTIMRPGIGDVDSASLIPHAINRRLDNGTVEVSKHVFPGMFGHKDGIAVFHGAALLKLDSLQRCDLIRIRKNYLHSAITAKRIRDAATPASPVRQTSEYFSGPSPVACRQNGMCRRMS